MVFPANVPANVSPANTNLKVTEGPETGHPSQTSGLSPMLAALRSFLAQVEELILHKCLSPNDPLAKDAAGQLPTLKRSLLSLSCPAESKKGTNRQGNTLQSLPPAQRKPSLCVSPIMVRA